LRQWVRVVWPTRAVPTEAEDGDAGLNEIERSGPDLIILDFAMPGLNGAAVAKRVQEKRPDLPIFVTGFAESAAIEQAAAGRRRFFGNPSRLRNSRQRSPKHFLLADASSD
jgi:CheY-like chemotaxis protein